MAKEEDVWQSCWVSVCCVTHTKNASLEAAVGWGGVGEEIKSQVNESEEGEGRREPKTGTTDGES